MENNTGTDGVDIEIQGMICEGCVASVRQIIQGYAAAGTLHVEKGRAVFQAFNFSAELPRLRAKLERAGYRIGAIKVRQHAKAG
jgi:copper chaperone CopZ